MWTPAAGRLLENVWSIFKTLKCSRWEIPSNLHFLIDTKGALEEMAPKRNLQVTLSRKSSNKRSRYVFKYIHSNNGISVINKSCRVTNRRQTIVSPAHKGIQPACFSVDSQFFSRCRPNLQRTMCSPPVWKYQSAFFEDATFDGDKRYCEFLEPRENASPSPLACFDWLEENCDSLDPFGSYLKVSNASMSQSTNKNLDPTAVDQLPFL